MNIEKLAVIEGLARAASAVSGTTTADKLLERIDSELCATSDAEEIKALQASNLIKQANINKLADVAIKTAGTLRHVKDERVVNAWIEELENIAKSLKQEGPEAPAAVVN